MTTDTSTTVWYHAQSILISKTFWVNIAGLIVLFLQDQSVLAMLPRSSERYTTGVLALLNIVLRLYTVRPVAFIAPGDTKAIAVEKI